MAESLAQKLNKLKESEMFVPYVQDREFGTYENNLTGQTVNREAELIFADQNKIRDAINTDLVQKHNDSLKPTYSSGDEGLARQLESKTYKVFGASKFEQNALPGQETNALDFFGDQGKSEENIEKADAYQAKLEAERAHAAQTSATPDDIAITNQSEKEAATAVFMSNYNDDQVYQPSFDAALSDEILNTSDSDMKETIIKTEELKNAEINNSIEILNNRAEIERVNNLNALKTLGLSDDNAPYLQDKEKGTYETENMTVFRPREIELENDALLKTQKIKDELEAEKQQAIADRLAYQDSMMNQLPGDEDIAGNNNYFADSGQTLAQGDIKESMINQEVAMTDVIAGTTAKDMTSTVREIEAERAAKEKKRENFESAKNNSTLGEGADTLSAQQQAAEEAAELNNLGSDVARRTENDRLIQRKLAKEKEEKRLYNEQITNADANYGNYYDGTQRPGRGDEGYKKYNRKEAAHHMRNTYTASQDKNRNLSDESVNRIGDHMDRNQAVRAELLGGDPYAFSTLSYPLDVTNSNENGHFVLFYVNAQNKTKYEYAGIDKGQRVTVGGKYTTIDKSTGPLGYKLYNNDIQDTPDAHLYNNSGGYRSQIIKNGGAGGLLYNNMTVLQRGRKLPYSGINSKYQTTTRITDSVALYLPSGIGNATSATYGDSKTGIAGYLALSGVDILKDIRDEDFVNAQEKLFGATGTILSEAAKKYGVAALETLTDTEGLTESFDKIFGQTLNPYIEVTYNSINMRTFSYGFKFAPTSKKETEEVQAIIKLFRFHMVPELKGDIHRYLTLPSTFDIHYMFQSGMDDQDLARENSFYNKIATCVLEDCTVDYTPTGVRSFADGAPTQITMDLKFKETEMLTKQKVRDGF